MYLQYKKNYRKKDNILALKFAPVAQQEHPVIIQVCGVKCSDCYYDRRSSLEDGTEEKNVPPKKNSRYYKLFNFVIKQVNTIDK